MSPVHQQITWAGHANYAAYKGGVMELIQAMAQQPALLGIRVNSIAHGAPDTGARHTGCVSPKPLPQHAPVRTLGDTTCAPVRKKLQNIQCSPA